MEHKEEKMMKEEYEGFEEFDGFLPMIMDERPDIISEEDWI